MTMLRGLVCMGLCFGICFSLGLVAGLVMEVAMALVGESVFLWQGVVSTGVFVGALGTILFSCYAWGSAMEEESGGKGIEWGPW